MDTGSSAHRTAKPARRQWIWGILLVALLLFAGRMVLYFAWGYFAGVDEATYMLTARAIATTGSPAVHSPDPLIFVPSNMVEVSPGLFYQKYAIGYPLLAAAGYALGGSAGAMLVNPIMGLLCIVGATLLAYAMLGRWQAVVVGACMALNGSILLQSISALSHISNTCFVVFGMWMLWRWAMKGWWLEGALAGLLLGYAASIRSAEVLMLLPVAWAIGMRWRREAADATIARRAKQVVPIALGFLIGIAPLLVFQWSAFGSPLRAGYSLTGEADAFGWESLKANLPTLLRMINFSPFGLPVLFPLAILGLVLWGICRIARRAIAHEWQERAVFLSLWIAPVLLLYLAYYWSASHETIYLRLYMSMFPAVIIAAVAFCDALSRFGRAVGPVLASLLVLLSGWMSFRADPDLLNYAQRVWYIRDGALAAKEVADNDCLLVAAGYVVYVSAFEIPCETVSTLVFEEKWIADRHARVIGQPPYELNPLRAQRLMDRLGDRTQKTLDRALADLLRERLAKGQKVLLLTPELGQPAPGARRQEWLDLLGPGFELRQVKKSMSEWAVYQITLSKAP